MDLMASGYIKCDIISVLIKFLLDVTAIFFYVIKKKKKSS